MPDEPLDREDGEDHRYDVHLDLYQFPPMPRRYDGIEVPPPHDTDEVPPEKQQRRHQLTDLLASGLPNLPRWAHRELADQILRELPSWDQIELRNDRRDDAIVQLVHEV